MTKHQPNCDICQRIEAIRAARQPALIAELDTGYAVLGDSQFFRGYSLLLCKEPAVELDELPHATRLRYLEEMSQLAEAVRVVTKAHKINYECLGNQTHHLHWHVFPRRATDPDPKAPVWGQMPNPESADDLRTKFNPARDRELLLSIRGALEQIRSGASAIVSSCV